jgi:hypothetical protein
MPTEQEMQAMRDALIAKAELIRTQLNLITTKRQTAETKELELETLDAGFLDTILNERFALNNRLVYTNDDQREVALTIARNDSPGYVSKRNEKTTAEIEKRNAETELEYQKRLYRPDELLMLFYANETQAVAPETQIPSVPTSLVATAVSSVEINISANPSSGATSYNLQRATNSAFTANLVSIPLSSPNYNNIGLAAETQYFYRISASNSAGSSLYSDAVQLSTLSESAPPPPSGTYPIANKVRWFPRIDLSVRADGVIIQGSNTSSTSGFVNLTTLANSVAGWNEKVFNNTVGYRYLRAFAANAAGNYQGDMGEMEFYAGAVKLVPTNIFGSGEFSAAYAPPNAFDGDTGIAFAVAPGATPNYYGFEVETI